MDLEPDGNKLFTRPVWRYLLARLEDIFFLINTPLAQRNMSRVELLRIQKEILQIKLLLIKSNPAMPSGVSNSPIVEKSYSGPILSANEKKIVELFKKHGELSNNRIFGEFPNINRRSVRRYLYNLLKLGYIGRKFTDYTKKTIIYQAISKDKQ